MKKTALVAFLVLAGIAFSLMQCRNNQQSGAKTSPLKGETFTMDSVIDLQGKTVSLDLADSNKTYLLDFWFKDCPPCIAEMRALPSLLDKTDTNFIAISIGVNHPKLWKEFLNQSGKNKLLPHGRWKHYTLQSSEDPRLKNEIPGDNIAFVQNRLKTTSFPIYLVIKQGKVIATPASAVDYLQSISQ